MKTIQGAPSSAAPLAPATTPSLPVIYCPECAGIEPGGFVGDTSGEIVAGNQDAFADRAGYLHCAKCGAVWNTLYQLPQLPTIPRLPSLFSADILGTGPGFNPKDADDFRFYRRMARTHAHYAAALRGQARQRASDRIYDAEGLCALLDLPGDAKTAILYHVRVLSERADMRALCNARREDGKVRAVRAEAITIATVALVMERFQIDRPGSLERMLGAFRFTRGTSEVTPDEYRAAYHSCAAWFGAHLWRDGPEDNRLRVGT